MHPGFEHPDHPYRRLNPLGNPYPKWIPCLICRQALEHHIDKKCPFDSTEFSPGEEAIDMILAEMKIIDRLHLDQTESHHGTFPRNVITQSVAAERYLAAHAALVEKAKWSWKE